MNYIQFREAMDTLSREYLRGWCDLNDGLVDDIKSAMYDLEGQYPEFIPAYYFDTENEVIDLACDL